MSKRELVQQRSERETRIKTEEVEGTKRRADEEAGGDQGFEEFKQKRKPGTANKG